MKASLEHRHFPRSATAFVAMLLAVSPIGCGGDSTTDPADATDNVGVASVTAHPAADVTTNALVTNTLEFEARCSSLATGTVRPVVHLGGGGLDVVVLDCPADTRTYPAEGVTGAHVAYGFLVGASCDLSETFAVEDFPSRSKCTVNGTDVGGRPLATVTMRYVKD